LGRLLGHKGEDQLLLRHGSGVTGCVKFFVQNLDLCSEFCGFLVKFAEVGDLPGQPSVVKVFNFALQVHEVAAGPQEKGAEPGGNQFNRVFLAMPHCVSLCIQVDNVRGLIRALSVMVTGNSAIFQPFDPFGRVEDSITDGDVEVRYLPIILDITIGGSIKRVLVVLNMDVEPGNLFLKAANFAGLLGIALSYGHEKSFSNGSENVHIEIGVGC
jgi:hypothetical protein